LLDKKVLQFGASHNGEDANSLHLSGLYYISKGDYISGAAALEKAVEKKQASAHSHFALAMVYPKLKKGSKEIVAHLEEALQKCPDMQYAAIRLASIQKRLKVPVQKRLDMLLITRQAVKEKAIEALDKAIILCHMEKEDYEKAAQNMKSREFHTWEGRHGMRPYWWNNQLLWARKLYQERKFDQALDKIHTSVVFPENLFAQEADYGLEEFETLYLKGKVLKSMGKTKAARAAFEKSANWAPPGRGNQYFFSRYHKLYAALSFRELGNKKEADRIISQFNKRYKDKKLWGFSEILFLDILKQKRKAYQKARSLLEHEDQSIKTLLVDKYLKGELAPFN
jgi:tetratricopeptide (TPR) repeat protein